MAKTQRDSKNKFISEKIDQVMEKNKEIVQNDLAKKQEFLSQSEKKFNSQMKWNKDFLEMLWKSFKDKKSRAEEIKLKSHIDYQQKWNEKHEELEKHLDVIEERDAKLKKDQIRIKTIRHKSMTTRLASARTSHRQILNEHSNWCKEIDKKHGVQDFAVQEN